MYIFVGLGNPGPDYAMDRHNVGFRVIQSLCARAGGTWRESRHQSLLAKIEVQQAAPEEATDPPEARQVLLVQPLTYMNLSGDAVAPLCAFYQRTPADVLVIHDDLELPFGRVMLKRGGGESGHRGLLSVSQSLGSRDYLRLRFGIGRPTSAEISISDYVLSPFSEEEEEAIPDLITHATDALQCCCEHGEVQAMNRFNRRKSSSQ